MAVHSALAALTNVKELNLEEEEAKKLAGATKEVLKFYPIGMSDKALAWVNLGVVATGIYGTRVMAYSMRRTSERQAKAPRIAPMPSPPPPPSPAGPPPGPPVNGHGGIDLDSLTPPWMSIPPENEVIP